MEKSRIGMKKERRVFPALFLVSTSFNYALRLTFHFVQCFGSGKLIASYTNKYFFLTSSFSLSSSMLPW